jgi:hypothetical protein
MIGAKVDAFYRNLTVDDRQDGTSSDTSDACRPWRRNGGRLWSRSVNDVDDVEARECALWECKQALECCRPPLAWTITVRLVRPLGKLYLTPSSRTDATIRLLITQTLLSMHLDGAAIPENA